MKEQIMVPVRDAKLAIIDKRIMDAVYEVNEAITENFDMSLEDKAALKAVYLNLLAQANNIKYVMI